MNQGLYTIFFQIFLQLITSLTKNRELVIYIILIWYMDRKIYPKIINILIIVSGKLLSLLVIFIKMFQFDI